MLEIFSYIPQVSFRLMKREYSSNIPPYCRYQHKKDQQYPVGQVLFSEHRLVGQAADRHARVRGPPVSSSTPVSSTSSSDDLHLPSLGDSNGYLIPNWLIPPTNRSTASSTAAWCLPLSPRCWSPAASCPPGALLGSGLQARQRSRGNAM